MFSKKTSEVYVLRWTRVYDYDVVGEEHRRDAVLRIVSAASDEEKARREAYRVAILEREPSNPYDKDAVKVTVDGEHVGYLPRKDAPHFGAFIEQVRKAGATCGVRAVVQWHGDRATGHIDVRLDLPHPGKGNPEVTLTRLSELDEDPTRVAPARPQSSTRTSGATASAGATPAARRKFVAQLGKAAATPPTIKAAESLLELAEEFEAAVQELLDDLDNETDQTTPDDVLRLLGEYGVQADQSQLSDEDSIRELLQNLIDALLNLTGALNTMVDDWEDADRDERADLKDDVSAEAADLLVELQPSPASGVTSDPAKSAALPPANWYDDPQMHGQLRYWDGSAWTEHRAPKA